LRTPGHAVVNVTVLAGDAPGSVAVAALVGAIAPDLPIVFLYLRERVRGTAVPQIWRGPYQEPFWLGLIHGFHSMPLAAVGLALGWALGSAEASVLFASMLLHDVLDLPVHGVDAHRHLYPFADWRLVSPISYWDVTRHARWVAPIEWLLVGGASLLLARGATFATLMALLAVHAWYAYSYARLFFAPEPST
jgi:hypothetical protein